MPTIVTPPDPQISVDKFIRAMKTPHKLLSLHPRSVGHPGNSAALSPAIVLTSISAFEGFAEDFTAIMLAHAGAGFAEIAQAVGKWNNPALPEFAGRAKQDYPAAAAAIDAPTSISVFEFPHVGRPGSVQRAHAWSRVLTESRGWMQVRHALTHGLTTGWRSERWPPPLRTTDPPASSVLRQMSATEHSLGLYGAINCARIYSLGARKIAEGVAGVSGHSLDWSALPEFE